MAPLRLRIDGTRFRDTNDREVTLHGINVAGDAKLPARPDQSSHVKEGFFDGDDVSFVGRPFSIKEAHTHFSRLRKWGYNTIRYIFTWEAIEHAGPGKYDEEFIQSTIEVLRLAKEYGFYIFMDPHQDVWSRFTGGSGAPMWTIYACGFDPQKLYNTQAAIVQNTWPDPAEFPRMIWATNYTRLCVQTIFTLFFAGKDFAPKAIIDGKNIQDYLQEHLINACKHLALRIHEAGDLEGNPIIGWESVNEPNFGYIGWEDLSVIPASQNLKKGTTPTAWQAILTGSGRSAEVETYDFGNFGPYKTGTELVDPKGETAWLDSDRDAHYGWKRDPDWRLGECLWAQHGVWNPQQDSLLKKDYFAKHPTTGEHVDHEFFHNHYFMNYYREYANAIRSIWPESIMFCQSSPFEIPPKIRGTKDDDPNMVFASHFYDGITLITKKWNRYWNVDVVGLMRGKYSSPAFALKLGESGVRNCFKNQLDYLRKEGMEYMGVHPCIFTEIGIPYDMEARKAYDTGDYTSQTLAMDANHYALEGSGAAGFTLWVYTASNTHFWGDNWNGEDLSIYSLDDKALPTSPGPSLDTADPASPSFSEGRSFGDQSVSRTNLKKTLSTDQMSATKAPSTNGEHLGFRAAEAFVRPTPIATQGDIITHGFDLRDCTFTLSLHAPASTAEDAPTEIFLPEYHFPQSVTDVEVSGGKWEIKTDDTYGGLQQKLKWWHAQGEQKITVRGVKRKQGAPIDSEEEESYIAQCQQRACIMM